MTSKIRETAFCVKCGCNTLICILHVPERPVRRGVVIVVGGPQYRVGSHRQFVLLARALAEAEIPCLRFDCRGMGDSDGEFQSFESIEDDIRTAVEALMTRVPGLENIVLWGLCDAASATLIYAHKDPRVAGIVLVNPWVRTETGIARTYLRHYYRKRLGDPDLWKKIARGEFRLAQALRSFLGFARSARSSAESVSVDGVAENVVTSNETSLPLPDRMAEGFARFKGSVLLILSGNDLTANEFEDAVARSPRWRELLRSPAVTSHRLDAADHTFSRRQWHDQVTEWTTNWLLSL